MAMSVLFPLVILPVKSTTERFCKLAAWDLYSYAGVPGTALGSPGTAKEAARGPVPGPGSCPWALAASFVVPGDPKAAPGSPAYEYGSQVANFKNLPVVNFRGRITQGNKIDMAIYIYMYVYIYRERDIG